MIEIKNISKSFDKNPILSDISLTVPDGSLICLLGPSGAGKTTLIRLITGSIKQDRGEIKIDGKKVPNFETLAQIGFMPQNDALYDDLSAIDNLYFFGRLYKMPDKLLETRIEKALQMVDLEKDKHKPVRKFSGGMKKRLSLAVVTLNEPKIMLLDEPTVGIDPILRRNIWQNFKTFRDAGCSIIVTTHIMDEIRECDMAGLILEGKLIAFDTVENLLNSTKNGRIEDLFLKNTQK